jgi:hypothetical protein
VFCYIRCLVHRRLPGSEVIARVQHAAKLRFEMPVSLYSLRDKGHGWLIRDWFCEVTLQFHANLSIAMRSMWEKQYYMWDGPRVQADVQEKVSWWDNTSVRLSFYNTDIFSRLEEVTKQLNAIQETLSQQTARTQIDEPRFPPFLSNAQTTSGTYVSRTDVAEVQDTWYQYSLPEQLPQCPLVLGQMPLESHQIISLFDQLAQPPNY